MLWEIGLEGCEVRTLRRRLELDSGQVSRLLRSLEHAGLATVVPSPDDRRIKVARLTAAGVRERALLDRRSDELARGIVEPLDDRQRDRLGEAMRTVERLLTVAQVEMRESDPADPDARECLRAYFAELDRRSDPGLGSGVVIPVDPEEMRPPAGSFLLACLRGEPIGCGGVRHHPGEPSEIKRMWVSETARGLGIGRRLLAELEDRARAAGAPAVRLETNRTLIEAIGMYRTAGYTEVPAFSVEPFADHWFEKSLSR